MNSMAFIEGVGGGELLVVLVVALMLFGSKNLPRIARSFGRTTEQMRRAVQEVKSEIMRAELEESKPPQPLPRVEPAAHLKPTETTKDKPDDPAVV